MKIITKINGATYHKNRMIISEYQSTLIRENLDNWTLVDVPWNADGAKTAIGRLDFKSKRNLIRLFDSMHYKYSIVSDIR